MIKSTNLIFEPLVPWITASSSPCGGFRRRSRVALHEGLHLLENLAGVSDCGEAVEPVEAVWVLRHLDLHPLPPQHVGVPPLPVLQRVEPADHKERRREGLGQLGVLVGHVRRRVIAGGAHGQEGLPREVGALEVHHRRHALQPELRLRPLLPAEVGLHGDNPGEAERLGGGLLLGGPAFGDVVDDVAPGALPGEEAAGEVDGDGVAKARDDAGLIEEAERVDAVVVGRRVAVLRGEAVVDGHDHGADVAAEAAAHAVEGADGRGEEREAAAVVVHDDGQRHRRRDRGEDARPDAAGGVDGEVVGAHAGAVRARVGALAEQAVDHRVEAAVDGAVAALHGVDGRREPRQLEPHPQRQRRRHRALSMTRGGFHQACLVTYAQSLCLSSDLLCFEVRELCTLAVGSYNGE
ncbi:hypothetical protein D1007_04856 [Hordeum vulgare]|nr:hypothetical protein D1007_04856 [Hordeum vulgare]